MLVKILLLIIVFSLLVAIIFFISSTTNKTIPPAGNIFNKASQTSSYKPEPFTNIELRSIQPISSPKAIFSQFFTADSKQPTGYVRLSEVTGKILIQAKSDDTTDTKGYVFSGACNQNGTIVYPLISLVNGKSQTIWEINMENLLQKLPLSVKLFKDSKSLQNYTRCAQLTSP